MVEHVSTQMVPTNVFVQMDLREEIVWSTKMSVWKIHVSMELLAKTYTMDSNAFVRKALMDFSVKMMLTNAYQIRAKMVPFVKIMLILTRK